MTNTGETPFESLEQEQAFFRALGKEIGWALSADCDHISFDGRTLDISGNDWGFGFPDE